MRLSDTFEEQRLSLDMTPLIDVVFLLVLFFAVSTSFISPKALKQLKVSLFDLGEEKQALLGALDERERELSGRTEALNALERQFQQVVAEREAEVARLSRSLAEAATRRDEMQWKIDALSGREASLKKTLEDIEKQNRTLEEQLQQAYRDFQDVNVALAAERDTSAARAAENEQLLARIAAQIEAASRAEADARARLAAQARAAATAEAQAAARLAEERARADARSRLLQALIDEKAAAIEAREKALEATQQELAAVRQQRLETEAALAGARSEAERRAEEERLLRNLLAEKAAENETLARRIAALDTERSGLASALAGAQAASATAAEKVAAADARLAALGPELERLRAIAALGDEQIRRLLDTQALLEKDLGEYLQNQQIDIRRDRDRLTLQLSDRILFDSGSANIKKEGLPVLERVARVVAPRLGELEMQIGGHTDNVPIAGGGRYPDNWSLSAARAVNVVKYLEHDVGLDPAHLSAVGFGEFRPIADNATAAGRAQNRRIEIVLVPR